MIRYIFKTTLTFLLILVFGTFSNAENAKNSHLTILTENAGESNYLDKSGRLTGHNVEIVKEITKRLGKDYPIETVPWARGFYMAKNNPDIMLFTTARTPEREDLFKWVGPLQTSKYIFYAKKDYNNEIKSLDDAKKVEAIGCIADDVRQKILLNKGFKNLDPYFGLKANAQNLKKLLAGRIDLWASSQGDVNATLSISGTDPSEIKEMFLFFQLYEYMAFSKTTSDETVQKWQKILDDIKSDGTYEKIMSRYATGASSMTFEKPGPAKE